MTQAVWFVSVCPDLFPSRPVSLSPDCTTVCISSALLSCLRDARKPDGSTEHVGHILTDWVSE